MNRHLNLLSLILLAALVLAAGALTGCGTRTGGSSSDESLQQAEDVPIRDDFDVSLTEADGKITVTIVNRSEGTAQLANAASGQLEILRDERFRQGDYYTDCLSGRGGA